MVLNADGTLKSSTNITSGTNGLPVLPGSTYFGASITSLGDLDGDGVPDLVVGDYGDETGSRGMGAVYVLFMNADATVKSSTKFTNFHAGEPGDYMGWGWALASLGDLDGDGISDLALGAPDEITDDDNEMLGAVYVLFMNAH